MSVRYETIMVFSMTLDEEAIAARLKRFTDLIAENGEVLSVDEWGRRRLAYLINDEADGYYVLVNFECDPLFIAELERVYRITDGVLRTLVVRKAPGEPVPPSRSAPHRREPFTMGAAQAAPAGAGSADSAEASGSPDPVPDSEQPDEGESAESVPSEETPSEEV